MPGTQPRGTYAFDPAGSSSQLSTQMLNSINLEEDEAEDEVAPPVDQDLGSSLTSFLASSDPQPSLSFPSSTDARSPPSSSLLTPIHPNLTQRRDVSMSSVTTDSEASHSRKRKYDARLATDMQPPTSKRSSSKRKTNDPSLNPVIISNAINSTLNRMVDVMQRTLDASSMVTNSAPSSSITSFPPPSIMTSPIDFPAAGVPSAPSQPPSTSPDVLDQVIEMISVEDGGLTEDELIAASLLFTSATEDAVRTARTFISLRWKGQTIKYQFLRAQLVELGLLRGRGKAKASEDGDD